MDLYGRDAELSLLQVLTARLDHRSMIDVGASEGTLAAAMLRAGLEDLYIFDPHPDNTAALRARFAADTRVSVYEHAIGDTDADSAEHRMAVPHRSLGSLVDTGDIPKRVGILKLDTEGHELSVVNGMGALEPEVVMVEHWTDLPDSLSVCPWTTAEMVAALCDRGFSHFVFVIHRREFVILKWDDGEVESGVAGSLIFLSDRLLPRVLPDVLDCAGRLAEKAVRVGQEYMRAADDSTALVEELRQVADELKQAADDRATLVDELKQAADDRLALVEELHEVAAERLRALEAAGAQLEAQRVELESLRALGAEKPR